MSVPCVLSFLGGSPGGGEILLVLLFLLLLFGSKRLPGIARSLGKTLAEFRRATRDVTDEIMRGDEDASRPAPKKTENSVKSTDSDDEPAG